MANMVWRRLFHRMAVLMVGYLIVSVWPSILILFDQTFSPRSRPKIMSLAVDFVVVTLSPFSPLVTNFGWIFFPLPPPFLNCHLNVLKYLEWRFNLWLFHETSATMDYICGVVEGKELKYLFTYYHCKHGWLRAPSIRNIHLPFLWISTCQATGPWATAITISMS